MLFLFCSFYLKYMFRPWFACMITLLISIKDSFGLVINTLWRIKNEPEQAIFFKLSTFYLSIKQITKTYLRLDIFLALLLSTVLLLLVRSIICFLVT